MSDGAAAVVPLWMRGVTGRRTRKQTNAAKAKSARSGIARKRARKDGDAADTELPPMKATVELCREVLSALPDVLREERKSGTPVTEAESRTVLTLMRVLLNNSDRWRSFTAAKQAVADATEMDAKTVTTILECWAATGTYYATDTSTMGRPATAAPSIDILRTPITAYFATQLALGRPVKFHELHQCLVG